ncbi:MAG TPA: aminomethyltransferase beta-barrel domain-containing protein, partial [Anaerolineae bacterium]
TREMARRFGLAVAEKNDSQDLCFVRDNDYRGFIRRQIPDVLVPGDIVDAAGRKLGTHRGLPLYTIGQRKGLGLAVGTPLFVTQLDAARNRLVVGGENELGNRELLARNMNWISAHAPTTPLRVTAKIRYRANETAATLVPMDTHSTRVEFDQPLRDITPGQYAVFYQDQVCLGGGVISK